MFLPDQILLSGVSPYEQYCVGYSGRGGYLTAVVMGQGAFRKTFAHAGSNLLDSIVAYDRAEIDGPYIGQINMTTVSSFCGPEGLIWGYDIARVDCGTPSFLTSEDLAEFTGMTIRDASGLRAAATALFGTNDDRHFPFLPGAHVFCAGRYRFFDGPTSVYSAVALGIPQDRDSAAAVLMEDVGQLDLVEQATTNATKRNVLLGMIRSVLEIGRNQRVKYAEIFIDMSLKRIAAGDVGCALVAVPYFHLARHAHDDNLADQTIDEWVTKKRSFFLSSMTTPPTLPGRSPRRSAIA